MVQEVTKESFDQEVIQETEKLVLVDCWAPSCGPCKALMPHVEKLSETYSEKLKVVKVNTAENMMLAIKLQILSLPTLIFFKNGKEEKRLTGTVSFTTLEKEVKELLGEN